MSFSKSSGRLFTVMANVQLCKVSHYFSFRKEPLKQSTVYIVLKLYSKMLLSMLQSKVCFQ